MYSIFIVQEWFYLGLLIHYTYIETVQFTSVILEKLTASLRRIISERIILKQLPISVLLKTCSENMPQIYKRTPMAECYFNKIAKY